ncbi:hypothetical protein AUK13_01055 [Candidatus Kuenenbacteria bacterium CG2_30_39_24]|uniref:PDZ domain-containing protein n=1 Tax=Candidatus Kuenenbacteria bacterium CG2_30_39_24 TaxID=1805236 RepID=A0A1J5F853_9BACT|nr:MAG: hypothetical protein AUK13_01055 [Candidatus Kuenenbacteria bacterium CG2_30_39_24]
MLDQTQNLNDKRRSPSSFFKRSFLGYVLIVLVIISFGLGVLVGKKKAEVKIVATGATTGYGQLQDKTDELPDFLGKDVNFKLFWDVWNIIQSQYIDRPIGETQLFYGALNGLVSSLNDPFSYFMEPQKANDFTEELSGKFEGVGMEIAIRNDVLTVVSPLAESPAEQAGIMAQDVILEIDGYNTKNIDISDAVARIRGEKGTIVNLKIYRPKSGEVLELKVGRDVIKIVSVELKNYTAKDYESLGDKKISLIKVSHFNADTADRFAKAVQDILLENPDGLILDLRGNPGGFLETAVEMANYWIKSGEAVVTEQCAGDEKKIHLAARESVLDKFKTVVLVNGGSASGSEIVAGALQDYGLAKLIGETTFGKGSVQQMMDLDDGSAVKITIARWLTPQGRTIDKEGIKPDIEIERTVEDYNNNLDPQLDRAISYFIEGK